MTENTFSSMPCFAASMMIASNRIFARERALPIERWIYFPADIKAQRIPRLKSTLRISRHLDGAGETNVDDR